MLPWEQELCAQHWICAVVGLVLRFKSKPWILFSLQAAGVMRGIRGDVFPAAFLDVSFLTTLQNLSTIISHLVSFPAARHKWLDKLYVCGENAGATTVSLCSQEGFLLRRLTLTTEYSDTH